jgi:cation:H+ antiporter
MINNIDISHVGLIITGLALLTWGSDRFVHGASALARNFGVTPLLIGLTIVAFATSAPEILVSIIAASQEEPGLAFGNAIGSNIVNIGLILGVTAMIRPISLESATLQRKIQILLVVSLMAILLFLDNYISRLDGAIMLISLTIVMIWFVKLGIQSATNNPTKTNYEAEIPKNVTMKMTLIWLLVGLVALLIGADWLVDGAIGIARTLNVSEIVIGITIVAFGTSLPELAISLVSVIKGEYGLAIGNIVGSNMFNLLAVIGIAAAIHPTTIASNVLSFHIFVMIAFTFALFMMTYNYNGQALLSKMKGVALLTAYITYSAHVIAQNI